MTQRPTMIQRIRYYYNQRDLLLSYVRKDLKERYVGSVIGFYWSVLNPLILLGIYTFVFSVIFRVRFGEGEGLVNAALYIFCGMVPWMAFSEAVGRSTGVLIDNANLIKKVMFPSKILPMYLVFSHAVNLLIGFGILLGAAIFAGMTPTPYLAFLPLYVGAQLLLTLGCCWWSAALNVFIRDMAQVIGQFMIVWMYLSPIFYSVDFIPQEYRQYAYINPMTRLIEGYRDMFLTGRMPDLAGLGIFTLFALVVCATGYLFFTRNQHSFADIL